MKTFLATFSAILCAAAVIWGVYAWNQSNERDKARHLSILKSLVSSSGYTLRSVSAAGKINPETSKHDGDIAREFARYLKMSLPNDANPSSLRSDFLNNYRDAIEQLRGSADPESMKWAAMMRKNLDEYFPEPKKSP